MFNYKTWKLYSPHSDDLEPHPGELIIEEDPSADPIVDENGNSITPDSLKKNMTIPAEAPGNDLEKVLSNMNGADPAYSVEGASGLIKQMNELADNPPSGGDGGLFITKATIDTENSVLTLDKTANEIKSAADSGKMVVAVVKGVGASMFINGIEVPTPTKTPVRGDAVNAVVEFVAYELDNDAVAFSLMRFSSNSPDGVLSMSI